MEANTARPEPGWELRYTRRFAQWDCPQGVWRQTASGHDDSFTLFEGTVAGSLGGFEHIRSSYRLPQGVTEQFVVAGSQVFSEPVVFTTREDAIAYVESARLGPELPEVSVSESVFRFLTDAQRQSVEDALVWFTVVTGQVAGTDAERLTALNWLEHLTGHQVDAPRVRNFLRGCYEAPDVASDDTFR